MSTGAFGIVIPGHPVLFDANCRQVDPQRWLADVANSASAVRDVTLFLNQPLPEGTGLAAYISPPPFQSWRFLGFVHNASPSATMRVRWLPEDANPTAAQVAIAVEPLSELSVKQSLVPGDEFTQFGKGVATDLIRYLESFESMQSAAGEYLTKLFNRWLERFEAKSKRDPYWWVNSASAI